MPVPLDAPVRKSPPPGKSEVTLAVQLQAWLLAVMTTGYQPAALVTVIPPGGMRAKLHPSACVTLNTWPAIVSEPVRGGPGIDCDGEIHGPVPGATPDVTLVIQVVPLVAVQAHPGVAVTAMGVPGPPAAATDWEVGLIEYEHPAACWLTEKVCRPPSACLSAECPRDWRRW